jgi:hypothetical protein
MASSNVGITQTTNILPVQALYDPTTLAFVTFIGPAGLPFSSAAGGVSSVQVSGGTTGLTTSGGPIVSSGTITLGGTLAVGSGGTGATTSDTAINNLLPSQPTHAGKYLITDGTNVSWSTSGANLSIVNDSTTNATRYLTFTDVTTGVITQEYVSSAGLTFNPSSSTLSATNFVGALTGNASTATTATRATNLAGGSANSIPYQSSSGTTTFLAVGSNGQYLVVSGGVPTWTSVSTVSSFSGGTTGLTPATATTGAVTLAGTLAVANGGTGVTTSSGVSSVVLRDANANITGNIFFSGFTNTAAAGTTTTLTANSTPNWVVTGSGGQTFQLPNATTLTTGIIYSFNNNQTSGAITVNNASGTLVVSVPSDGYVVLTLLTNGTSAGTWDYHFQAPSNVSWSTNTFSYSGSITSATWNATAVGAIYGGTAQTTYTTGDTLYASASNTLSKLAVGSTGQVLTVAGGVPTWANTTPATTITDDTTTASTRYINFTSATSGSLSTIYTSSTKLQYNPSTGALTSTSLTPTNALGTAYGGTGQATASAGFNALSPITTTGDLIIGNGTNSATRLAIGANTYVLTSNGTTASWVAPSGGSGSSISNGTSNVTVNSSGGTVTIATSGSTALTVDTSQNVTLNSTGALGLPSGTTAQRPASPINGQMRYNTTTGLPEIYQNGAWAFFGSNTITSVEYLVVAGGGGGGRDDGGGGGAGGYLTAASYSVTVGSAITVTIGAGGAGAGSGGSGANGNNSVFGSITATYGGGGGGPGTAAAGGSGGGAYYISGTGASGTSGQGNAGGGSVNGSPYPCGGGGGAGGVGGTASGTTAGAGGVGLNWNSLGAYYAGGGGGSNTGVYTVGAGGNGGGGAGGGTTATPSATAGTANTGGGGGGATSSGASGGSGVVIVRYLALYNAAASTTGSPTVTTVGAYRYYTFTSSGSITF